MKVCFLDRDGTIINDYPDREWKDKMNPEFLEGSIEGLKILREEEYLFFIVSNQYLINNGIITNEQFQNFNNKVI